MNMVHNKVILITGGNTGIGAASAMLLAENGANVIINHRDNASSANKLAAEINKKTNRDDAAFAVKADVSDESQVQSMISTILNKYGKINVIVNNAGLKSFPKNVNDLSWKEMQAQLDITLKGAYNVVKSVLPYMLKQKGGNIINVLSEYTIGMPPQKLIPYVTAKYALEGFSKSMAAEVGPSGIRVNMISPGITKTGFTEHLPEKLIEIIAAQTPLRRIAAPEDIAKVILFLASSNSAYLTGVNIPVCGGFASL